MMKVRLLQFLLFFVTLSVGAAPGQFQVHPISRYPNTNVVDTNALVLIAKTNGMPTNMHMTAEQFFQSGQRFMTNIGGGAASNAIANLDGLGTNTTFRGWTRNEGPVTNTANSRFTNLFNGGWLRNAGKFTNDSDVHINANVSAVQAFLGSATYQEGQILFADGGSITDIGASVATGVRLGALRLATGAGAGLIGVSDGDGDHSWGPHTNSFARSNDLTWANTVVVDAGHPRATTSPVVGQSHIPAIHITNALDAITNNQTVLIRPATYSVTPVTNFDCALPVTTIPLRLINKSNVTVRGEGNGVQVFGAGHGTLMVIKDCENIEIENIDFNGDHPKTGYTVGHGLYGHVLLRGSVRHLTFRDCIIRNYGDHGVLSYLLGCSKVEDVKFINCRFGPGGMTNHPTLIRDGAAIASIGRSVLIDQAYFSNCLRSVELEGVNDWTNQNNIIVRNSIFDFGYFGREGIIALGASVTTYPSNFTGLLVEGNYFKGDLANSIHTDSVWGINLVQTRGATIRDNWFDQMDEAVFVQPTAAGLTNDFVSIKDNLFTSCKYNAINAPLNLGGDLNAFEITGNKILGAGRWGILVGGRNGTISGNRIYNWNLLGAGEGATYPAIWLRDLGGSSSVSNIIVSENIMGRMNGSTAPLEGIRVDAIGTNVYVLDNIIEPTIPTNYVFNGKVTFRDLKGGVVHYGAKGFIINTNWLNISNDLASFSIPVNVGAALGVISATVTNEAYFQGALKRDIETFDTSIDWATGNSFVRDWTNNLTITFANVTDGRGVWLYLTNNGSTAAFTLAFPAGIIWINHRDQNSTPNFDRRPGIIQTVYFYRRSGVTYAEGPNGPDYNPVFTYGVYTNTSATTVILDPGNGSYQRLVAAHNILLLHTNAVAQRIYNFQLDFVQDGTGTRTVTFGTNAAGQFWKASGGTPSITTNANAESVLTIRSDGTGTNMFVLSSTNFTRL